MNHYELIDHTADMGLRIFGDNIAGLFQNAGYALFDVITDISMVSKKRKRIFSLERDSMEELLVEWLNSLLYVFDTEHFLFRSFTVKSITNNKLVSEAFGEIFNEHLHPVKTLIKAVTYHNLEISEHNKVWQATVILDI